MIASRRLKGGYSGPVIIPGNASGKPADGNDHDWP